MSDHSFGFEKKMVSEAELKFHHVGLVVASIEQAFGVLDSSRITYDPLQDVRLAFIDLYGLKIEVIEPVSEKSPVRNALMKKRPLLHICFETPNLEILMKVFSDEGRFQMSTPVPAVAFEGRRILWFMDSDLGLVEILEE